MATISNAATTSVARVSPETGLLEDPIRPTRFPETAAKKKPSTIITSAATLAPRFRNSVSVHSRNAVFPVPGLETRFNRPPGRVFEK